MANQTAERKDTKNVIGLFRATTNFEALFKDIHLMGYGEDAITVMMSQRTRNQHFSADDHPEVTSKLQSKAPEGFTAGSLGGGLIGAIVGGLFFAGAIVIPGSQIVIAGPALGALAGAGVGAYSGGLIGTLVGMNIPEVEAKFYSDALDKDENVLIVVDSKKEHTGEIEELFRRYDALKAKS